MKKLRCRLGLHKFHRLYYTKHINGYDVRHYCAYCPKYVDVESGSEYINPLWGTIVLLLFLGLFIAVCIYGFLMEATNA